MALTLVTQRVQSLFMARGQAWCDQDFIIDFMAINADDLEMELAALGLSYEEQDLVIADVPANTVDLSFYQSPGQLLANMMSPYSLEWKRVGSPDTAYNPVARLDKKVDVAASNPIEGILSYCWKGGIIQISPSSIDVTIRVGAQMLPDVFASDSDTVIKGATNWLAYRTAEMIANLRGGGASKMGMYFEKKGDKAETAFEAILIQQEQLTQRRFAGRRTRGSGPKWRLPRA